MADDQLVADESTEEAVPSEEGTLAEGQEAAEGSTSEPALMELTSPTEAQASPWSVRPGLLWGRGLWESAGRLTFMEWNLLVLGTLSAILAVLGAMSIKFGPVHPLVLSVGLLGLGVVSLASQWSTLMLWNRESGQTWRAGLFVLLELFYFGLGTAFALMAGGVVSASLAPGFFTFGLLFACGYAALAYLCEVFFNWEKSAAGAMVGAALLAQIGGFLLFHQFMLLPAVFLTVLSLALAINGILRGALSRETGRAMTLLALTLALCLPLFAFIAKEFRVPVQDFRTTQRLAPGLDSTIDALSWAPAMLREDMPDMRPREATHKLAARIAYASGNGDQHFLGIYDPSLGEALKLPVQGAVEGLWWSSDSNTLAFNSRPKDKDARLSLVTLPPAGSLEKGKSIAIPKPRLVSGDDPWVNPSWSHDNRSLLFSSQRHGISRVFKADARRKSLSLLTPAAINLYPSWSPAAPRMAYVIKRPKVYVQYSNLIEKEKIFTLAWNNARSEIVSTEEKLRQIRRLNQLNARRMSKDPKDFLWSLTIADSSGRKVRELVRTDGAEIMAPAWSPKGDRVAFIVRAGNRSAVATVGPDGSWPMRFFNTPADVTQLAWSPNGEQLAFLVQSKAPHRAEIWTVRMDGIVPSRVYEGEGSLDQLTWCPTNQFLAAEETVRRWCVAPDLHSVVLVNMHDEVARHIMPWKLEARYPTFSPNGTLLAYLSGQHRWLQGRKHAVWAARLD